MNLDETVKCLFQHFLMPSVCQVISHALILRAVRQVSAGVYSYLPNRVIRKS